MSALTVGNWYALFPPAGDKAIAVRLQEAISRSLLEPDTRKLLFGQGLDAVGNTPDEFAKLYTAEVARWSKVVKAIDLQPN